MTLRDNIRQRPAVGFGVFAALCMISLLFWWMRTGRTENLHIESGKVWLTTDDGKTWFPDDGTKVPPMLVDGKEAVRCHVYTNDGGKTKYVQYLERIQPAAKKQRESKPKVFDPMAQLGAAEVKRPGDSVWILRTDPKAMQIIDPKPGAEPVYPD